MHLLLALAKKRMRVKIKIKPSYLDRQRGGAGAVPLLPTTPLMAHGACCQLSLQPWGLLSRAVGWEAGSMNSRF